MKITIKGPKLKAETVELNDFNGCFMYENVYANYALWASIFENNIGQ